MKVLKIAFGHPDNVLSLCSNLSKKVDLTLVFVVSGRQFQRGLLNLELDDKDYGLHTDYAFIKKTFPESIVHFVGSNHRLWILKLPSRKLLNFKNTQIYWQAIKQLKRQKFDIVHYNGFSPYIYLFYSRFGAKIPQFWTLHDYKTHSGEKNTRAEKINRFLAGLKRLTIIQHYEYLREKVIQEFQLSAEKVKALLSGPLDVFHIFKAKKDFCPDGNYILFFGRIRKYKGVDVLLKAYSRIKMEKPQLVIAGKGDFGFDISPFQNDPQIVFLNDYIENEVLIGLIKHCQYVVVPYRDATHSAVIATSYAMNKPVIASDVDGLKEVVFDKVTGRLVKPDAPGELQSVLEELIQNPEELDRYTANIIKEKESGKIAWSTIIDHYVALYSEKLKQG